MTGSHPGAAAREVTGTTADSWAKRWAVRAILLFVWVASVVSAGDDGLTGPQAVDDGFAQTQDLRIYYQRFGKGFPLVLVHGWGTDSHTHWVPNGWIQQLAQHRTVIAIDVRGHGRSDKPLALAPYSYAQMSNDVLAVMDKLDLKQVDFMGYSMGAFMGAHLLGHHAERFRSMVLGGIGDESDATAALGSIIAQALRAESADGVEHPYGRAARSYVESTPTNDLQALAYSAQKMWSEGFPLVLAGTQIAHAGFPVLVVNGADDHPYVGSVSSLIDALPNARYHEISGTDHMTVVGDPRFKEVVLAFLESVEPD